MERPTDGNMDAPHGFLVVLRGEQIGIEDEYRVGMDPVYTPVFQNVPLTATVVERVHQGRAGDEGNDLVGLMGARRLRRGKARNQTGREAAGQQQCGVSL